MRYGITAFVTVYIAVVADIVTVRNCDYSLFQSAEKTFITTLWSFIGSRQYKTNFTDVAADVLKNELNSEINKIYLLLKLIC
jgi:hypothetical protein